MANPSKILICLARHYVRGKEVIHDRITWSTFGHLKTMKNDKRQELTRAYPYCALDGPCRSRCRVQSFSRIRASIRSGRITYESPSVDTFSMLDSRRRPSNLLRNIRGIRALDTTSESGSGDIPKLMLLVIRNNNMRTSTALDGPNLEYKLGTSVSPSMRFRGNMERTRELRSTSPFYVLKYLTAVAIASPAGFNMSLHAHVYNGSILTGNRAVWRG
ncbi:hypothetical protein GGR50DRAFT_527811 [Xylaria sp. CBS 124048]|nr:hypothetical protein GGR50DRAFT_527811 [Xylaria sp. CBS 124048]